MDVVLDLAYATFSCCFPSPALNVNGKKYKVLKLLGEGGFSYVYLVQEASSGRLWAMKKVSCPIPEVVREALKEVDAYKRFKHPNIIHCYDSSLVQDREGKMLYLILPYYKNGNLQDAISAQLMNKTRYQEGELLQLFMGDGPNDNSVEEQNRNGDSSGTHARSETEMSTFIDQNDQDGQVSQPLMTINHEGETGVYDDAQAGGGAAPPAQSTTGESAPSIVPYAHRDIKPGNVMLADDGVTPILRDSGSAMRARVEIKTRQDALLQQDLAAQNSSMPYRAPELFDVKTGSTVDEKVDIWSLGCLLFAAAYGHSPFENPSDPGGSIAMAVLNNQYRFPQRNDPYSDAFRNLIRSLLVTEPSKRPDIHETIKKTANALRGRDPVN